MWYQNAAKKRMSEVSSIGSPSIIKLNTKIFKVNDTIKITKNSVNDKYIGYNGVIRYIGNVPKRSSQSDIEIKYGIELMLNKKQRKLDIIGENNGILRGTKYFECKHDYNISNNKGGIFLSANEFRKIKIKPKIDKSYFRKHKKRNNAAMFGNVLENTFKERIDVEKRKRKIKIKKFGPREAGTIDYYGGDSEYKDVLSRADNDEFLSDKALYKSKIDYSKVAKPTKLGPRQIGKNDNFEGIDLAAIEEEERKKREERERRKLQQEQQIKQKIKKLGPRDISQGNTYIGTDQKELELESKRKEAERLKKKLAKEQQIKMRLKKEGPRGFVRSKSAQISATDGTYNNNDTNIENNSENGSTKKISVKKDATKVNKMSAPKTPNNKPKSPRNGNKTPRNGAKTPKNGPKSPRNSNKATTKTNNAKKNNGNAKTKANAKGNSKTSSDATNTVKKKKNGTNDTPKKKGKPGNKLNVKKDKRRTKTMEVVSKKKNKNKVKNENNIKPSKIRDNNSNGANKIKKNNKTKNGVKSDPKKKPKHTNKTSNKNTNKNTNKNGVKSKKN